MVVAWWKFQRVAASRGLGYRTAATLFLRSVTLVELIYIYGTLFLFRLHSTSVTQQDPAKFTLSSLLEATIPVVHPLVAAGSNKCEVLKNFFGITYEQMQKNNSTFDDLNIDVVTKNGNVKYNMTATKRLYRMTRNATNIIVLIHGFMESSNGYMVKRLAPEFLKQPGRKILALDGRKMINLEYFRSSTYARFMGEKLGTFLSEMIKNGQDPSRITLIGHSLGGHIAGIAGKQIRQLTSQSIGRITALDPAGPCFSSIDLASKLDRTDAVYVDVIHTNGGMLGLKEPVGHKDFFPNGGMAQPGCYISTCDHSRVWELYAESVNAPNHFPARKCENWTMFRDGLCGKNEVAYMGINSEPGSPGLYFLTTGSSEPFGLGPAGSG